MGERWSRDFGIAGRFRSSLSYAAHSPWRSDFNKPEELISTQQSHEFKMASFEVLTREIAPQVTPGLKTHTN